MELTYLHGKPLSTALIKQQPEDFAVTETLSFTPDGEGCHVYLFVKKVNLNTHCVVDLLSRFAHVHPKDIGFAGRKDKHAVTKQWFSVSVNANQVINWEDFKHENAEILHITKHNKKLKIGSIKSNYFELLVRDISDLNDFKSRCKLVNEQGFPNYFGEQRFGFDGKNLDKAKLFFDGCIKPSATKKKLYISSARSALYNYTLCNRLKLHKNNPVAGDVAMLSGTNSFFAVDEWTQELLDRLESKDIAISSPLCGNGEPLSSLSVCEMESKVAEAHSWITSGLQKFNLQQDRRLSFCFPVDFVFKVDDLKQQAVLNFSLPKGCFATSLLREVVNFSIIKE